VAASMLLDTDVLIWLLRGNPKAEALVDRLDAPAISIVTYMELMQGARSRQEASNIRRTLQLLEFRTLDLSSAIGTHAALYVESFAQSHGVQLADALIAATAAEHGAPLVTGNAKHLKMLPRLEVVAFSP
jgi:predicted nucleic acid-binding protein